MRLFFLIPLVVGIAAYLFWYQGKSGEIKKQTLRYALGLVVIIFILIIVNFLYQLLFVGIG